MLWAKHPCKQAHLPDSPYASTAKRKPRYLTATSGLWYSSDYKMLSVMCRFMQIKQFWRPAAWSDLLHAYPPCRRRDPGPTAMGFYICDARFYLYTTPVLLCLLARMLTRVLREQLRDMWPPPFALAGLVLAAFGLWVCLLLCHMQTCLHSNLTWNSKIKEFWGWPDDHPNLQLLGWHLRELQTTRRVLVEHRQFQQPAALEEAGGCDSIAVVKALHCHAQAT